MRRLFPQGLFGQTVLIILGGLLVSQVAGALIYLADKEQAVRAIGGFSAAQRIANVAHLINGAPPDWQHTLIESVQDPLFAVSLSEMPMPLANRDDRASAAIVNYLLEEGPMVFGHQPYASISDPMEPQFETQSPLPTGDTLEVEGLVFRSGSFRNLSVGMPLEGGQWLLFHTVIPDTGTGLSNQFFIAIGVMALVMLSFAYWIVQRVTNPLRAVAAAATQLGRSLDAPVLPESGAREIRETARAFNQMQAQLRELVNNRTQILAAISHDLRTPLTLLRLRTESLRDGDERAKMLGTIAEMEALVESTLLFARAGVDGEASRETDLAALASSVVDDLTDAGLNVSMSPSGPVIGTTRPTALKRALTNLARNAAVHGKSACVAVAIRPSAVDFTIDDEGPGIPHEELHRVVEPFYRLEASRNRGTGGHGLGLAIASSMIDGLGGTLTLANRPQGGLRATVSLPIAVRATEPQEAEKAGSPALAG